MEGTWHGKEVRNYCKALRCWVKALSLRDNLPIAADAAENEDCAVRKDRGRVTGTCKTHSRVEHRGSSIGRDNRSNARSDRRCVNATRYKSSTIRKSGETSASV